MPATADLEKGRRRVAMFGGSFDPPHRGHVSVAGDVADQLQLDEVLWVPAARSPHKRRVPYASDGLRREMVRAAIASDPRFRLSDIELERGGASYTVDTLRTIRERLGDDVQLVLILGADQYRAFDRFREPEDILRLATLAVMDREGDSVHSVDTGASVRRVPVRRLDISSSDVRARVLRGERVDDLLPEGVARIIEREGLYRGVSEGP